ncbi:four-helix bundle copper-binding protein [Variovorax sp. GB1R11]|uniref:four-helix bundle copper-binding protein n=1 Tax=Variovorax sp. GB1R11 TaxID=3443741 RepID=UPI003F44BAF1
MSHETDSACIEACNECAVASSRCVAACLSEDNVKMMARCIALNMDCMPICRLTAAATARGSEHAKEICSLCADICEACAQECDKHKLPHCQSCAKACRVCAIACLEMPH